VRWADRGRAFRTLTFWLRPGFALRVLNRFQRIGAFDRSIALASSGLTALVPLTVVTGSVAAHVGGKDVADRVITRFHLTGAGAGAVRDIFSPAAGTSTGIGLVGLLFLAIAVLSFARAMQRLFEQAWELAPLSVRNTPNDLLWIVGFLGYLLATSVIHAAVGHESLNLLASLLDAPITAVFAIWSGTVLSAHRIAWRDLVPLGVIASAAGTVYAVGATIYVPHQFSSYATRYGVIGAVLAMISTLFCVAIILVGSAAARREFQDELGRIRSGGRPPDDEVRREWEAVVDEARSHWASVRERIDRRRS
jgi:uncharacterized BrkB/YihY/UPF0761 family membrane protein